MYFKAFTAKLTRGKNLPLGTHPRSHFPFNMYLHINAYLHIQMNIHIEFESVLRCIQFVQCCLFLQQLSSNGKLTKSPGRLTQNCITHFVLFFNALWLNRDSVLMLKVIPFTLDFTMVLISLPLVFINICTMHFLL